MHLCVIVQKQTIDVMQNYLFGTPKDDLSQTSDKTLYFKEQASFIVTISA